MIGYANSKCRSLAFLTLDHQLTFLHLDHILANSQPETGAAVFAGDGRIGLFKWFEYSAQPLPADADTRIADGDIQDHPFFGAFLYPRCNRDMAAIGKF